MEKRKKLIKDINALLTEMKVEDLKFILQQTEVLEYNRKVRQKKPVSGKDSDEKSKSTKSKTSAKSHPPVYIEQTERSKFFNICIADARLFVDYQEIQALYKIAVASSSAKEAAPRFYRWLKKERSDVLAEGNIPGPASPVLKEIYEALLDTFTSS